MVVQLVIRLLLRGGTLGYFDCLKCTRSSPTLADALLRGWPLSGHETRLWTLDSARLAEWLVGILEVNVEDKFSSTHVGALDLGWLGQGASPAVWTGGMGLAREADWNRLNAC